MGCGLAKQNRIVLTCLNKDSGFKYSQPVHNNEIFYARKAKNSLITKVSSSAMLDVIAYLSFAELKEVGKVNRMFNYLSKQNEILIKFFKKKETVIKQKPIDSFALLRKATSLSNHSTSSSVDMTDL